MTFFSGLHDLDAPPAASTVHLPIQVQFTRYKKQYNVFHSVYMWYVKMGGSLESPGNQMFKTKSKNEKVGPT